MAAFPYPQSALQSHVHLDRRNINLVSKSKLEVKTEILQQDAINLYQETDIQRVAKRTAEVLSGHNISETAHNAALLFLVGNLGLFMDANQPDARVSLNTMKRRSPDKAIGAIGNLEAIRDTINYDQVRQSLGALEVADDQLFNMLQFLAKIIFLRVPLTEEALDTVPPTLINNANDGSYNMQILSMAGNSARFVNKVNEELDIHAANDGFERVAPLLAVTSGNITEEAPPALSDTESITDHCNKFGVEYVCTTDNTSNSIIFGTYSIVDLTAEAIVTRDGNMPRNILRSIIAKFIDNPEFSFANAEEDLPQYHLHQEIFKGMHRVAESYETSYEYYVDYLLPMISHLIDEITQVATTSPNIGLSLIDDMFSELDVTDLQQARPERVSEINAELLSYVRGEVEDILAAVDFDYSPDLERKLIRVMMKALIYLPQPQFQNTLPMLNIISTELSRCLAEVGEGLVDIEDHNFLTHLDLFVAHQAVAA